MAVRLDLPPDQVKVAIVNAPGVTGNPDWLPAGAWPGGVEG